MYGEKCEVYMDRRSLRHLFTQKNINMRQQRCLDTIHYHQCEIKFHLEKANLVANALSRKLGSNGMEGPTSLLEQMRHLLLKDVPSKEVLTAM